MTIDIKQTANEDTITITGRLDTSTAPILDKTICGLENTSNLVIDMGGIDYISSAGLRVLLNAQKKMQKTGSMKLINVCDSVMEVFEITGFADILKFE